MRRALVLEDDEDLRALLCGALVRRGFDCIEAATGFQAEAVLSNGPVDIILIDGILPDGSGVNWAVGLRGRGVTTPVLFMSAYLRDFQTFAQLTNELDVAYVFYKPLDPDDVAQRAGEAVGGSVAKLKSATAEASATSISKFPALRAAFGARLPSRLSELEDALSSARTDAARVAPARHLAHRLRGTAGSYGYSAVGTAVGRIEDLLVEAAAPALHARTFVWDEVHRALLDARAGVDAQDRAQSAKKGDPAPARSFLVVDRDPAFLALARKVGQRVAVSVLTAATGAEALQVAGSNGLLGVLIDGGIEGETDAFRLARDVRGTHRNTSAPIAFASIEDGLDVRVAAAEAGATRFLERPISEEGLASLIQQMGALSEQPLGTVVALDDDDDMIAEYARVLRSQNLRLESIKSPERIFECLERSNPDLLILDLNLPRVSGLDVCRAIRLSEKWELLPILVATARADAETRRQAFQAGATDVVVKPIVPDELIARVGVQLERARLIRDRSEKDPLSGLLLRRPFLSALQRALGHAAREGKKLSLALLDLDHFKAVNDLDGHAAGDAVIAELGNLLRRRFRVEDLRARWGGEEFILAFPGQTAEVMAHLVRRLLQDFRELSVPVDNGATVSATFSAGVVEFPTDGGTAALLIKRADERLYLSKSLGRNRVSIAAPADPEADEANERGRGTGPNGERDA